MTSDLPTADDKDRILSVLDRMADAEEYRRVYAHWPEGDACVVDGCVLSQQEHHRLAYGMLAELRTLREQRSRCVFEHGGTE